jgi:hypothetical protein
MIRRTVIATALLALGCAHTYYAGISALRPEGAPAFTQQEQDEVKAIAVEIGRAAGFLDVRTAPEWELSPSDPHLYVVGLSGEDFEQATVSLSAWIRRDRREILVSIVDAHRGEPLPSTRKLIEDVRKALERAFPDALVEVESRTKLRTFAP